MAQLPDKVRKSINTWLRDLDNIMVDLQAAQRAGVEGVDALIQMADDCKANCGKLKAEYFPNQP
jgi:ABC-type transporter Mla MlaB component